ncbi:MAG: ABC transporter permease, partial [Vicinamibacterales bacterium]
MNWWQRVRHRWRLEDQLDAELRFHFDRLVQDYLNDGASEREARRRARAEFGGVEEIKDDCRDARGTRWVHDVVQDVRFSARLLAKERALTFLAVAALAMGMGVNNAMFTFVDAICLRGLPIAQPGRVADIAQRDQTHPYLLISPRQFTALESASPPALGSVAAYAVRTATLRDDRNAAERVTVAYVSAAALATIGESTSLGRDLRLEDARAGAPSVAILSHAVWQSQYDGDPSVLGSVIRLNGTSVSVVGVMRDGLAFPNDADLWQPLPALPLDPDARVLHVFARLTTGFTMAQAQDGVSAALSRVVAPVGKGGHVRTMVVPINTRYNDDISSPGWMAFISVGLLLVVIACSNVANILLARGVNRRREVSIRLSLGATRARIVRQLLIESTMLAAMGGAGAIIVTRIGLDVVASVIPSHGGLPYWVTLTMDWRIASVLGAVCLGTVVVFGLAPAIRLARTDLSSATKESSATVSHDRGTGRWTWGFLTLQLALTVIFVSKLGITLEGFYAQKAHEPAIDAQHILTLSLVLPTVAYRAPERRVSLYRTLADRLAARASAIVSVAASLPSQGGVPRRIGPADELLSGAAPPVTTVAIDGEYFDALGLDLIAGRVFARGSSSDDRSSLIVNQRFADVYFHGANAVGQRVRLEATTGAVSSPAEVRTIVGIAPSLREQPTVEPPPIAYVPLTPEQMSNVILLVRAVGPRDMASVVPAIRDEMRALDPNVPVGSVMSLEQASWQAAWRGHVATGILTTVVAIAVALATIGLMGLTAFGVGQRRREFGIRLALGARPSQVVALTLRRVFWQVLIGMAAGSLLSIAWDHFFEEQLRFSPAAVYDNLATTALLLIVVML